MLTPILKLAKIAHQYTLPSLLTQLQSSSAQNSDAPYIANPSIPKPKTIQSHIHIHCTCIPDNYEYQILHLHPKCSLPSQCSISCIQTVSSCTVHSNIYYPYYPHFPIPRQPLSSSTTCLYPQVPPHIHCTIPR